MSIILQIWYNIYLISLQVLAKKSKKTLEGYIKIHNPQPLPHPTPSFASFLYQILSLQEEKIFSSYNCFRNIGFSCPQVHKAIMIFYCNSNFHFRGL